MLFPPSCKRCVASCVGKWGLDADRDVVRDFNAKCRFARCPAGLHSPKVFDGFWCAGHAGGVAVVFTATAKYRLRVAWPIRNQIFVLMFI